ncbi:MAG: hypothetical protein ACTIJ6_07440 [Leucobacter sp.]
MKSVYVTIIGVTLAAWMSAGRWLFGIGGELTWWYVPTIGLVYAVLLWWVGRRITVTRRRGRRTGRAVWVALILSWVCAIGFGLTVPDLVNGDLVSIVSLAAGSQFSAEMSIALCNPLGIVSFTLAFIALGFAIANGRDPRPDEDAILDALEAEGDADRGTQMVPHPLA